MNSGPNSDSKQCPESKLGQVHSMHTHGLGYAHAASWVGRVVAWPPAVSWPHLGRVARCAARRVMLLIVARPCVLLRVSQCSYAVSQGTAAPYHSLLATVSSGVSRHTSVARPCARALGRIAHTAHRIMA